MPRGEGYCNLFHQQWLPAEQPKGTIASFIVYMYVYL
jgi:hypothetical protein